ncbi:MAG: hypothetical protein AB7S53_00570 [Thiomonas sp.]
MSAAQQHLHIHLGAPAPGGRAVRIDNRRPVQAMRLFEGRTAAQAVQLLPLLYSLCGHAQHAAARDALRAALPPADMAQRRALHRRVQFETVREHLLQIHRDWPALCDAPPDADELRQIVRRTDAAAADPATLDALVDWVSHHTLGLPPGEFLAFDTIDALRHWARATAEAAAPRWLGALYGCATALPAIELPTLESLPPDAFRTALVADATLHFVSQPTHAGACMETGPAARHRHHPVVRAAAHHGLLGRLAARLVDLCTVLVALKRGDAAAPPPSAAAGLGWVDSARGRLIHHAELDAHQRIAHYRILAPTEWNSHPQGLAAKLLAGIGPGTLDAVQKQARLVVQAIDPCVLSTLKFTTPQAAPEPAHA